MPKLIICRGLMASGKSTWAQDYVKEQIEQGNLKVRIVCRDDIRKAHGFGVVPGEFEDQVTRIHRDSIRAGLKNGETVIVADTNMRAQHVKGLAKIAEFFGADVEVKDFHLPLMQLILRDQTRGLLGGHRVGEEVIREWWNRYNLDKGFPKNPLEGNIKGVTFEKYIPNETLPLAVIFDIDGTLASHEGVRSPYDYTKVINDNPRDAVINAMKNYMLKGYAIIVLSGREDSCREDTLTWLKKYTPFWTLERFGGIAELHMRPAGDKRQDRIIKGELFDKHIRNRFNVEVVFDDRDSVVSLWRDELGIDCFQVNWGDF